MVNSKPKLKVPDIIHTKYDEMLIPYNNIASKVNELSSNPFEQNFTTRNGIVVDLREFASRIESVLYKLRWAAKGLEQVLNVYDKYGGSLDARLRGMTDTVTEDLIFYEDVFFYFGYSALDIVAGIIDKLVETGIERRNVYFTTVLDFLASQDSPYARSTFTELQRDSYTGWIHELRQYRIFITHHSRIPLQSQFIHSQSDKTTEINLFLLPDDPSETPCTYEEKRKLGPYCVEALSKELDVVKVLLEFIEKLI